jgi:2,3-bisphosphoglycerate-dependent phosphoglycerate mutase
MSPYTLVLLRHGESAWNAEDRFAGWVDVPLTDKGRAQAARAGEVMARAGVLPDVLHTSVLGRATTTGYLAAEACGRGWVPVRRTWRLNERHYGALQGRAKTAVLDEHGPELFMRWRRSDDTPPPPLDDGDAWSQVADERYTSLPPDALPRTESLADVRARLLPHWYDVVVPDLRAGRTVCVVAHGNSLRVLARHLDGLTEEATAALELPTGVPWVYRLTSDLHPLEHGGTYLTAD